MAKDNPSRLQTSDEANQKIAGRTLRFRGDDNPNKLKKPLTRPLTDDVKQDKIPEFTVKGRTIDAPREPYKPVPELYKPKALREGEGKKSGKAPTVTQADIDKSPYDTLRDYMNHYKYDDAKGKYVPRAKGLARSDAKPPNARVSDTTANPKKYKKGGSVSSRGDGCAQRGKTRGKMV